MIRIKDFTSRATSKAAVVLSVFLLFAAAAFAQTVNVTVAPTTTALPDGTIVPMWSYFCAGVAGSTAATTATCSSLNPNSLGAPSAWAPGIGYQLNSFVTDSNGNVEKLTAFATTGATSGTSGTTTPAWSTSVGGTTTDGPVGATFTWTMETLSTYLATATTSWSPVVITVPTGSAGTPAQLTINLTNNLSFSTGSGTNTIPTSIVIVGQVGGGLGSAPTTTAPPDHSNAQGCVSWFIAANPPGTPCTAANNSGMATPPKQGPRIQSMGAEVAGGATTSLTWSALKPGTYLLESGTHPSIQVPMGLIGVLVVTAAPTGTGTTTPVAGTAYPATANSIAVPYNAELPLEFSEIDPVQNKAVAKAVATAGFSESTVWSGMLGSCGDPTAPVGVVNTCYPPAVNYTPFYFLINGVALDKTNVTRSVFAATSGVTATGSPATIGINGTVLLRLVNAGLRMHTPSIVNSLTQGFNGVGGAATVGGFTVIAEDGNLLPNVAPAGWTGAIPAAPRVQTDVLMVPSKVFDVLVNVPPSGGTATPALPVYARDLALSGNSSERDAGMLAYISVNNSNPAAGLPTGNPALFAGATARDDNYPSLAPGLPFTVSDPSKGVIANDTNVYGVTLLASPTGGTITCGVLATPTPGLCANGTFIYTPTSNTSAANDSFTYCANGTVTGATCSSGIMATVHLSGTTLVGNPTCTNATFTSNVATYLKVSSPGGLTGCTDPNNLPLTVVTNPAPTATGGTLLMDAKGGFDLSVPAHPTTGSTINFSYTVQNSQGRTTTQSVTVQFPTPSNLQVNVLDAQLYANCAGNSTCISGIGPIPDYRWIIEEDQTFFVDPNCTTNQSVATPGCPAIVGPAGTSTIPTYGTNFHTSAMTFVAQGCTGQLSCEGGQTMLCGVNGAPACPAGFTPGEHMPAVCDVGNGACRYDSTGNGSTWVDPSQVHLDPSKRYYISVLPGDAGNPFPANVSTPVCPATGGLSPDSNCGHGMSGAPIPAACNFLLTGSCTAASTFAPVNVLSLPTPLPTGKLSVIVFEDDFPLNGEQDGGGGQGTIAPIEPGLGGFNIVLWDTFGGLGDVTGQDSFDAFNQPLSNGLAGTIDPTTGVDACPISLTPLVGGTGTSDPTAVGMAGMIVTCPKYEADNQTLSPLAGQAVIYNLMQDKFSVQAYPGADRIARGEQWLQTNTLDGQHPHDSFIRLGEPGYFQEYGPAGYHVAIGFANPAIINARHDDVCNGNGTPGTVGPCTNIITGQINVQRLSRTPDQRLYPSGSHDALTWTQCWVSLGDPDGEDFMFSMCDSQGNFKFASVPGGNWRLTIGDQWNDQIIDGLSIPANVGCTSAAPNQPTNATTCPGGQTLTMGNIGVQQWQSNVYTKVFIDDNKNGIPDPGEIGIPLLYTRVYYRDGHNANGLATDFNGVANFNEEFPLFNWYVIEADSTRYKRTGIHTVYDASGPADGSSYCGSTANSARPCGTSTAYQFLTNTFESVPLPTDLSVPGAVYCAKADCGDEAAGFAAGTPKPSFATASTGRIDPPWVNAEGWAGTTSHGNWIDFGFAPYAANETGGIHGQVTYASTRPFDDASQMILQPWEPLVPNVTINLYQEGFASDGVTPTLNLVDTTQTSSWDNWAQGFWPSSTATATGGGPLPYMNCPGQGTATGTNADLFFFTLYDQPNYLDWYTSMHSGTPLHPLPYNSQYKCYDAMHMGNQLQPAPYDGEFSFPSVTAISAKGKVTGTNCTICVPNPDSSDAWRFGSPMLPPGKYVVEAIMPPGYEIYKEEDKNLLIGDNYIAPVTQQFAGLGGAIFILPDQASVASMYDESGAGYNPTNYQNQTTSTGLANELSGVPGYPGFQDPNWPCVGEQRVVPDYLSLFPKDLETAPYAGATRPLCDRKEVTLATQMNVRLHFAVFTSTHIAAKFTGGITDDFTSEFDPFAPQFGEKFAPPNMPVSTKDYLGNEISRVYSDHWGQYDGLTYSSWEVNPPNITGYSPSMMTQCMNDPGPILDKNPSSPTFGQMITDPLYNSAYSDFCYELPYMPGLTAYLDTPVVPTEAFVGAGYNNVDCAYPDATPGILEVDGDGVGPWVHTSGVTLTITAIGNAQANNNAYSGPSASVTPFNAKTVGRHYGFGSQCLTPAAGNATCNTLSSVTIGGRPAVIDSWSDSQIQVTVPTGVPNCVIQQQAQYQGTLEAGDDNITKCGQLVITAGNGQQSVDSVTVTIGGKLPTHVSANQSVQSAIDAAAPGDLIIIDPTCVSAGVSATCNVSGLHATTPTQTASAASHTEMLIMWKPVRLQGVGAVSSVINANANPAGKLLDPWRRHINCLFGLTLQGVPYTSGTNPVASTTNTAPYDPSGSFSCPDAGWNNFSAQPNSPQIDRLPLEATIGWDATLNGNLAEQLQEPSLMGAFEGAGITVLAKGLEFHGVAPWSDGNEGGAFPATTTLLTGVGPDPTALAVGDASPYCHTVSYSSPGTPTITSQTNPYPSNFMCNPSSIDGLTITNSSQGGGGIFAHGWAHHLQIANNRVYNNAGTLTGGISVGQGEFATPYVQGGATNAAPGSCSDGTGFVTNQHLPYCLQLQVNVHNNFVTNNSSLGDELFSGTLAGGGGVTVCTGNDYYKFNFNWVCGNLATGEGGGLVHLGEIQNGDIEHNSIVFNQSQNPTIPTNGGGIQIMGTPDTDPVCGIISDSDCPPGLSDGVGHNLVINANLIQGNMAESGSGGGIRLQQVNGTEVSTFPTDPTKWNFVSITNNMIVNNVAGWDGGGISLQDSLNVAIINNTIASNDSLASSGVLTQSIGTPLASGPAGGTCVQANGTILTSASCPQVAGVASTVNSTNLTTTFGGLTGGASLTCPFGEPAGTATASGFTSCAAFSNPQLSNNVIWQNRSFYIGITVPSSGALNQDQQNQVALFAAGSSTALPSQTVVGQCTAAGAASYWDIGVRGDAWGTAGPNHASGFTLNPTYSILDDTGYASSNTGANPNIASQYCNGSRVPPTCTVADGCGGPSGYGVPPGIADATTPNPVFAFNANATVDEGNNWVNVSWGPLSLADDSVMGGANGNFGGGPALGNYALASPSPAIDYVPLSATTLPTAANPALALDFFGHPRPDPGNPGHFDVGAVEFQNTSGAAVLTSITPNQGQQGTVVNVTISGSGLAVATAVNISGTGIAVSNFAVVDATDVSATFTIAGTATVGARTVTVTTPAGTSNSVAFTVTTPPVPTLTIITPSSEIRGTSVGVTLTGTNFLTGDSVVIAPAATGVTVSGVTVLSPTQITATITSTLGAAIGNVNVEVVDVSGASNPLPFAITGPVLTSIAPVSASRNTTGVAITLNGTGLLGATSVDFSGGGITVVSFSSTATSVSAIVNVSAGAAAGARNVTVTAPGGTSNAQTFTVTVPPAGLSSISPTTGARGTTQAVTLTGVSLTGGTVNVSGGNITVGPITVSPDGTTLTTSFTIAATATLTARNVTVTAGAVTTTPVTFTVVNPGTPILTSITPSSGLRGTPHAVTLAGSGFAAGATVNVVAPANGLTVTGVAVNVAAQTITATFNTTATAVIGPRSITVTNVGGAVSGPATYTVTGPVLTGITPASGARGQGAIPITLSGSGLTGATAVTVSGTGITVGPLSITGDTSISTTFTIATGAAGTARNVTVTAPGGTSNAETFLVTIPGTPTLTSVSPAAGVRGTTVPVTLMGTNFDTNTAVPGDGNTVAVSGGGVTVGPITGVTATTLTTTFTISAGATLGAHNVTVTAAGAAAASNALPFTVQGATLTSISPNTGLRGTTVAVTFTGANLTGATGVNGLGGTGITVNNFSVMNSTTVTANLVISTGATVGVLNLGLATPIGNTNLIPFTVTGATLTAISQASATRPTTGTLAVPVTITGTNLTGTTALTGLGAGVTATGITSTSTSISATLNVSSAATTGARNIRATTAAGVTTNTVTFTVN